MPAAHARTAEWTGLPAGSPIAHARKGSIVINRITGPFKKINDSTFEICFEKGLNDHAKDYQCWFAAEHTGDADFKPAVQQAKMVIPVRNTEGRTQTITFPKIENVKQSVNSVSLMATSSANMPVKYYVREGPAFVANDKLIFTQIPPRSKFPVKVTIVAWQYGSTVEPALRSAKPVDQSFYILK